MRAYSKFMVFETTRSVSTVTSKNTLRCRRCGHKGNTCNNDDDNVNSIP